MNRSQIRDQVKGNFKGTSRGMAGRVPCAPCSIISEQLTVVNKLTRSLGVSLECCRLSAAGDRIMMEQGAQGTRPAIPRGGSLEVYPFLVADLAPVHRVRLVDSRAFAATVSHLQVRVVTGCRRTDCGQAYWSYGYTRPARRRGTCR